MKWKGQIAVFLAGLGLVLPGHVTLAGPAVTAFTYQGRLTDGVNPATGIFDFRFTLLATSGGSQVVAGSVTNAATGVTNGLFTATLDFEAVFDGSACSLEIATRTNGIGAFTTLNPRQLITPAPLSLYAASAGSAATAVTANSVSSTNLVGTVPLALLPASVLTNNQTSVLLRGTFTGDGGGLTNLNGSAVSVVYSTNASRLSLPTNNVQSAIDILSYLSATSSVPFLASKTIVVVDGDSKANALSYILKKLPWWRDVALFTNKAIGGSFLSTAVNSWATNGATLSSQ